MVLQNDLLRRKAFERLAVLSTQKNVSKAGSRDLPELCALYEQPYGSNGVNGDAARESIARAPMGIREFEVLLALGRAAPGVHNHEHAQRLLHQIGPYLPEVHTQSFRNSPFLKLYEPSPWELMTHDVTFAILSIAVNHPDLHATALTYVERFLDITASFAAAVSNTRSINEQEREEVAADHAASCLKFSVSMLGFMTALAEKPEVCLVSKRYTLVHRLHSILSEPFLVKLEATLSSIRNAGSHQRSVRPWKRLLKNYSLLGRPIGAIILQRGLSHYVASAVALFVAPTPFAGHSKVLDFLVQNRAPLEILPGDCDNSMLEGLTNLIIDAVNHVDADAEFLRVSSLWQQKLGFSIKANALTSFLCCSLVNEDIADADILMSWLEGVITDPVQLENPELAQTALGCMAVLAKTSKAFASALGRSLPRLIVQTKMTPETAAVAADALARVLLLLPQDMQISTLYSLGNILSVGADPLRANQALYSDGAAGSKSNLNHYAQQNQGSAISLVTSDVEETAAIHGTVVQAIVRVATRCNDDKITALAISMLVQKIGRGSSSVDIDIIRGSAALGLRGSSNDLRPLLKLYARLCHDALIARANTMLEAVLEARLTLARGVSKSSQLYELYLTHLLDVVVSTTGSIQSDTRPVKDGILGAEEIGQVLPPLAILVAKDPRIESSFEDPQAIYNLSRDAWFNLVAHDFTLNSQLTTRFTTELEILALYSPSLIDKDRADARESGIELNTVLKRNMNPAHTVQQKQVLINSFPTLETEIKSMDYAELTFLNAAQLIAVFRARRGDCTRTMDYFFDTKFKSGPLSTVLYAVAVNGVDTYLARTQTGKLENFAAPELAHQLVTFLEGCCHRIAKVQHVATAAVDRIVSLVPSALVQRSSLFALLELLTLLWTSCLEAETDAYEWKSVYTSEKGHVSIELSDDFTFRRQTLNSFHKRCRLWVTRVLDVAPLDMKGLLQTYLSEYDDEGAYGHVALGRSFALEMGCLIPASDQRLASIEHRGDLTLNAASDFIAQYTTRQEYRAIDAVTEYDQDSMHLRSHVSFIRPEDLGQEAHIATLVLKDIQLRIDDKEIVPLSELRPALRRAAALLCTVKIDHSSLAHYLVSIPFSIFTKQAIKLGISLWTGVLWENARLESRILAEVAMGWEASIRMRRGVFASGLHHFDPFYIKEEFAPSDRDVLNRRQWVTHDLIAPHFRLVQFLSSHFNATRLCSPSLERIFFRLARVTLAAMKQAPAQPLAREVHFQIILLTLKILIYVTGADDEAKWMLKDQILTIGLKWFAQYPRFSFGANKLQIKSELRLIGDVISALQNVAAVGARPVGSRRSLQPKHELLAMLLQSEASRLSVWLSPLDSEGSRLSGNPARMVEGPLIALIPVAWAESASLAVQLATRFQSARLALEIRSYLLADPAKAIDEPEALQILLGPGLPGDVAPQLKYLLYWAPVNPITAVTYFLPAYSNHSSIIQYAVRALESHSVDVTFFYVPQIVQALRYDMLGYVERYIIETAKFSQLFAHQIIWNIKANAYKDEESQVPDPVKPTLDKVMDALIDSFSVADKDFYEREFEFFNEVTSISGKLRPFIKRPKPEKKAKIEEELRKIQVDVGVYLPSNPDGVVIGIDRKSGKPLQSHAKAPYMATFRIRKERADDLEATDGQIDRSAERKAPRKDNTYEVWQSAIFKVGDDCRQDVLALQMIAAFRGIFNNVGLDVYVFPYRVTATAPGCGVIDVLPNSISRDMLGREQVNGLYEYFISKYGSEDSLRFQAARNNFVKSMAAYSIISYLLQFKDRHNGNIMIDDAGHILHIDFGFCFDIAPGGVKFERAPFKLTSEMVAVMGGSASSQPYAWFEELCIKAFLAARPYAEKLAAMVVTMLDSGLPCFKPETVKHFKERFVLEKSEREAAEFVRMLVRRSDDSTSTKIYDQFQLLTNGIPY